MSCNPKLREQILSIVESLEQPRLALFYSSPRVAEILDKLYERWEAAGRRGEPIDYAECDELEVLYDEAQRAKRTPLWQAMRVISGD